MIITMSHNNDSLFKIAQNITNNYTATDSPSKNIKFKIGYIIITGKVYG